MKFKAVEVLILEKKNLEKIIGSIFLTLIHVNFTKLAAHLQ